MDHIGTWLLVLALLIPLAFFLIVDTKGVLIAVLRLIGFLVPPVVLGILFGGLSVFAFFIGECFLVPWVFCIRELLRYFRIRKTGVRTQGRFAGYIGRGKAPRFHFPLEDGTAVTESAGSLRRYTAGDAVTVLYARNHPEHCYIERDSMVSFAVYAIIWAAAGAVYLWVLVHIGVIGV